MITLLMIAFCATTVAQSRQIDNLNTGWAYRESLADTPDALSASIPADTVNLPHTWNQWDAVDNTPGYRRSRGWYSRQLAVSPAAGQRYLLYFEAANTKAGVFVNGKYAGGHVGGYLGFEIDITEYLNPKNNRIDVWVDNGYDPHLIPSQKSDFFIYGGLTRDVWLKTVPETYLSASRISTPNVSEESASTTAELTLAGSLPEGLSIRAKILHPTRPPGQSPRTSRQAVAETTSRVGAGSSVVSLTFPEIKDPELWSPASPTRYPVTFELVSADGKVIDRLDEHIGYRWYRFDANGPFYLNGERLLLRGTHRHEEHAGYGGALPDSLHRADIEMMKEVGVNFLRLGHYPQDPSIYEACDELGIIVWDELPWCRGGKGGAEWEQNTRRLLKEQIVQNYNHPSIFFWSLGNEIYWLPDFPGGDDTTAMNAYLSELNELAHQLDPQRLTAIRKYYAGSHIVDVFSPSIWSGWYAGVYKNYGPTLEKQRGDYTRFLHMEYGGSSHVGRHTETPVDGDGLVNPDEWAETVQQIGVQNIAKTGDWTENYIVDLFDWHLSISETTDWFAGNAQWAFKDFGTPLRPENPIPYLNQKGLVDRAGKPKDAYYVFKSYWAEEPFTYIESHTWTERSGPPEKARRVKVFSNCDEVELVMNGLSLRKRSRKLGTFPACGLYWDVTFAEGGNDLVAHGYVDGERVYTDELRVNYTYEKFGTADHIDLSYTTLPSGNYLIEAVMRDTDGRRVLDYEDYVYFSADGSGELMIDYGTPTRSQVIGMANGRAAIEMIPGDKRTVIEARNQDFKGSYLVIPPLVRK